MFVRFNGPASQHLSLRRARALYGPYEPRLRQLSIPDKMSLPQLNCHTVRGKDYRKAATAISRMIQTDPPKIQKNRADVFTSTDSRYTSFTEDLTSATMPVNSAQRKPQILSPQRHGGAAKSLTAKGNPMVKISRHSFRLLLKTAMLVFAAPPRHCGNLLRYPLLETLRKMSSGFSNKLIRIG